MGLPNVVLQKVARLLHATPGPLVVAGDFNDVSWLKTTHQLVAGSAGHDVCVGRGLYPTFDARVPLLRWPLDCCFGTPQCQVVALARPADVGANYFPLLVELALARE